ncbi:MAG TPA: hypothetical protein VK849_05185, partial [Longimicrobiales bacterium]|nr:hypothetical protein [Longimicrobiales bacterium]
DCLFIEAGALGDRYRIGVVRSTENVQASDVQTVTLYVTGQGVTQAQLPAAPARMEEFGLPPMSTRQEAALRSAVALSESTARVHARLRAEEEALVARLAGTAPLPTAAAAPVAALAVEAAASPDKMVFDISTDSQCTTTADKKKTGILVHENDDIAFYQDSTQRVTKPLPVGLAQQMANYYTAYSKAMVEAYWGPPTDIDGNGKIVVFASPVAADTVAAFVWSGDFFDKDAAPPNGCPASNEMEVIYFNTDLILQMQGGDSYQALATLAHEAKHVVSLYNRIIASIRAGASRYHPSWIEEGTAEISSELSSRIAWAATGGPAVGAKIKGEDFYPGGTADFNAQNWGVVLHLARTVWYLASQPNGVVVTPNGADDGHSVYGSGWVFMRWLGDAYGGAGIMPQGDAALFRQMNDSLAAQGTAGILEATGKSFLTLLDEYVVAVMLHEIGAPQPIRAFTTYDFLTATGIFTNPDPPGVFPWPVTTSGDNISKSFASAQYSGPIGSSGIRIHDLVSNGTGSGAQLSLDMSPPGKVIVTRIR